MLRVTWAARAFLLLTLLVIASRCAGAATAPPASTATPPSAADARLVRRGDGSWWLDEPERLPLARVVRVVDGDTLIVAASEGGSERVRVFGLDAPEASERCGPEATRELEQATGSQVRLLTDRRTRDQFGRELRYLFTPDGRSIDADLVRHGSARAWREDGAFRDILVGIENAVRVEGVGCLWQG